MLHLLARAPALLVLVAAALASPSKIKERTLYPRGWDIVARAPADHAVTLRIALPQPSFDVLEQHLYEVSDPAHARYGAHLSLEEVASLSKPHGESVQAVDAWLASHGVPESACSRSPSGDWVRINVTVAKAEEMLDAKYYIWKHIVDGDTLVRTLSYSLPEDLHAHIDFIQPTTMFARLKGHRTTFRWHSVQESASAPAPSNGTILADAASGIRVDASCNKTITVDCLKQLYNTVGYKPSETRENAIGITGYLEQNANIADLQQFYRDQVPAAVNSSFKVVLLHGGENNQSLAAAGIEANLDTQFAYGLTFPTPGTFWSTGGSPPFKADPVTTTNTNEPYADWLDFILSQKAIPQTITTSYGDDEQTVPESYAKRVCADFAKLGARGVTLTFSSGDNGVGDGNPNPKNQTCFTNDGRNATAFIPLFPASCPYVTSVGGTIHVPEVAVFFSGGGFSNYFPRPLYQEAAVRRYLDALPEGTYKGLFNPNGRAIPDVAAQADNFRVFVGGRAGLVGGTSAASPTFAAIVSLLNDARISRHLPPLGFLNPLLYTVGLAGLKDITAGNNPGCGTPGFNATKGWDPVTGLGTPNFGKLKEIVS
ncbi:tripeptidyl peptidase A [Dentipellis sp. KUC8613]|nr:tripeptidyl peptidase A [Dentipellis sp. KUC8613]